jgi:ketosteroid isomerase-like protein
MPTETDPRTVIAAVKRAVDDHDLDALAACFYPDYLSEQPFHPDRAFRGSEQMRRNWEQIFRGVPDIRATVLRCAVDGKTAWTEWELRGKRSDGAPAHMAMVTIAGIEGRQVAWMRLYLEPVTHGAGIDASVRDHTAAPRFAATPGRQSASLGGDA